MAIPKTGEPFQGNVPATRKLQVKEAEDIAATLRTICFHIRRGWYRRSQKPFMNAFPRPAEAPVHERPALEPPAMATLAPQISERVRSEVAHLLACHGEDPDLFALLQDSCEQHEPDFTMPDNENLENDKTELTYVYSFDGSPADHKAWRTLVDTDGFVIIPKEYAFEVLTPEKPNLMITFF